jgi:PAS domain S-box-containing protein
MLGYTAAEMVGRKIDILAPPGLEDDIAYIIDRIRRGELVDHYETRRQRKDGTIIDVALTVSPIRDASGAIAGASKIARDITERRRAEAALRESEARFRALLENSPRMMWVDHADGAVEYLNAAWRAHTGHGATMAGLTWTEIIHEADRPAALGRRTQAIAAGEPYNFEIRLRRTDGAYRWHVATVAPLKRDGKVTAWVGTATDVHDMRTATEVLEQRVAERTARLSEANAELEAFAYSVAHDLRAPLRGMQGFSNALLEDYGGGLDQTARDYVTRIARAAAHMDDLINDLLAYSRLTREDLRLESLSLSTAVDEALGRVQAAADEHRAEVQVANMLPRVRGNRTVLIQVLANLIGNAVKFTAPGVVPRVAIRAEECGDVVRIWIEDNGIGIAEKHQERIFQVFQRLHSQRTYPGTGIGLAIVRKGIERMGGRVGVESRLGSGSHFWFELAREE